MKRKTLLKYILASVVLCLLGVSPVVHGQEKRSKSDAQENNSKPQSHPPSKIDTGITQVSQKTTQRKENDPANNTDGYLHHLLLPEVLTTVGLLIVGIVGTCAAIKTLKAIQRQGLIMIQQSRILQRQAASMEGQLGEMVESKKQTERVIAQMKETAIRDLRAYLGISQVLLSLQELNQPTGMVEVKNFGKTPAFKVRQWVGIAPQSYPLMVQLPVSSNPSDASVSIISPGVTSVSMTKLKKPVPPDAVIGTSNLTIYVYGRITYEDVFGQERFTEYRFFFGGTEPARMYRDDKGALWGAMNSDSGGNDAD